MNHLNLHWRHTSYFEQQSTGCFSFFNSPLLAFSIFLLFILCWITTLLVLVHDSSLHLLYLSFLSHQYCFLSFHSFICCPYLILVSRAKNVLLTNHALLLLLLHIKILQYIAHWIVWSTLFDFHAMMYAKSYLKDHHNHIQYQQTQLCGGWIW